MGGNKKRGPGGKTTVSPPSSMSIVEKLQILRSLNCGFSESDLSNCLRQSGYRVDIAAEKLVTGQYRPVKKRNNNSGNVFFGRETSTGSKKRATSSSNYRASAAPRQGTTQQRCHSTSTPSSSHTASRHRAEISSIENQPTHSASTSPKPVPRASVSSSSSIMVTPKAATPAARKADNSETTVGTQTTQLNKNERGDWLLCRRWVGDGVNLQRNGACDYREEFHVRVESSSASSATASSSSNAPKPLRFRSGSGRMDGSFPRHLTFLGPLLRDQFIRVKATALMEERRLPIGAQVAFSLSVWVIDPVRFFAVFDDSSNNKNSNGSSALSYSKQFFATVAPTHKSNRQGRTIAHGTCREFAFLMLQWAQHGKISSSSLVETCYDNNSNEIQNEKKNNNKAVTSSDDGDDEGDIDNETNAVHTSAEEEDAAIPQWARQVLRDDDGEQSGETKIGNTSNGKASGGIEKEMDTPLGFRKGIELRSYQKQSLYWMTQRENQSSSGRKEFLELLHELASESSKTTMAGRGDDNEVCVVQSQKLISCDCGPVLVDTNRVEAPSVASVLHFEQDYAIVNEQALNHPLWERRFLCNDKHTKALSFYVQPSFRNASTEPPPPPFPCRGGILADSMG